jgi:hypothetical protein
MATPRHRYKYDTTGVQCLDTLQEYIAHNNPDGLTAERWKDKYWREPLGLEHQNWGLGALQCKFGHSNFVLA